MKGVFFLCFLFPIVLVEGQSSSNINPLSFDKSEIIAIKDILELGNNTILNRMSLETKHFFADVQDLSMVFVYENDQFKYRKKKSYNIYESHYGKNDYQILSELISSPSHNKDKKQFDILKIARIHDIDYFKGLNGPEYPASLFSTIGLTDVHISYNRISTHQIQQSVDSFFSEFEAKALQLNNHISFDTPLKLGDITFDSGHYHFEIFKFDSLWYLSLADLHSEDFTRNYIRLFNSKSDNFETLGYNIADISEDNTKANLQFNWGDIEWKVPIEVSYDEIVERQIQFALSKDDILASDYIIAANYYLENGKNLEQALEWVNTYLSIGENSRQFWNVHLKAKILAKMGNRKEAIATAEASKKMASAWAGGDFGYVKRNEDLLSEIKGNK